MISTPRQVWFGDRLVPWSEARLPIEDRGLQFAESLYEVLPITAGRARLLPEHALRMRRAAESLGIAHGVPSVADWERIAADLVRSEEVSDALLYAQVTGGAGPRRHLPEEKPAPFFFAYVRAHRFPGHEEVSRGIRVITTPDLRWERCDLKTTMLLPAVLAKREAHRRNAADALLVGKDGEVREGASSNLFIVEGGRLSTPEPTHHLLPGTTGPVVSRLGAEAGLTLSRETIPVERLLRADEVFLTATSFLVMPVVSVDDHPVGTGAAGPKALDLARRMRALFELETHQT